MKKLTIGRDRNCDIRIDDSTDKVSRRQAVLTFSPTGKMHLYDTGANGTYVNGVQVQKPNGVRVRRGDQINFAQIADLDWNKVKDPYRPMKLMLTIAIVFIFAICVLYFFFGEQIYDLINKKEEVKTEQTVIKTEEPVDSLILQTPVETVTPKAVSPGAKQKGKAKEKGSEAKDNSEVKPQTEVVPPSPAEEIQKRDIKEAMDAKE